MPRVPTVVNGYLEYVELPDSLPYVVNTTGLANLPPRAFYIHADPPATKPKPTVLHVWRTPDPPPFDIQPPLPAIDRNLDMFWWSDGRVVAHRNNIWWVGEIVGNTWNFLHTTVQRHMPPMETFESLPGGWKIRERRRQEKRTMPVWVNERWWQHAPEDHFVHVATDDPLLVAFTESPDKGERNIHTKIKPGRYLSKYLGDYLNAKQIAFFAAWQTDGTRPKSDLHKLEVKFATTQAEIASVYERGPTSCMDSRHYSAKGNPVRSYAAGDLAVAFLEGPPPPGRPDHNVLARCLVWPDKKVAGRVYPTSGHYGDDGFTSHDEHMDCHHTLKDKLKEAGYTFHEEGGSFEGATIAVWSTDKKRKSPMLPYLDLQYGLNDHHDDAGVLTHFTMKDHRKR